MIVTSRIATGIARWSLLVGIVVALVCGIVASATDSIGVVTIAYSISAAAQFLVGLSYLLWRPRTGTLTA